MDIRKLGLLAIWLALPAFALNNGIKGAPARETSEAELIEKSVNGISPVPTPRPILAEMELFKRAYTLPSDYCGWYADYKSASYTCGLISASCINVGNYRGCCDGPSLSCASTFYSACIPGKSLTASQSCGRSTICCSGTNYPECGTILFSSSADPDRTYTNIDCWSAGFGSTYAMQDYPPSLSSTETTTSPTTTPSTTPTTSPTTTTTTPGPTTTTSPPDPGPSTPIGAIVGGVVGGVAVLGLIGLGIVLIMRRKKNQGDDTSAANQQQPPSNFPPPQMGQVHSPTVTSPTGPGVPPAYDPRYSYANPPHQANAYQMSPDPNTGVFGHPSPAGSPPFPSPSSPDPVKMAVGPYGDASTSPVQFQQHEVVNEAPATNPRGVGNNAAELA